MWQFCFFMHHLHLEMLWSNFMGFNNGRKYTWSKIMAGISSIAALTANHQRWSLNRKLSFGEGGNFADSKNPETVTSHLGVK